MDSLDKEARGRIVKRVDGISERPYLYVRRLIGVPLYRLRVGDYRVVMDIKNNEMLIFVVQVDHRGRVYDRL
ncbi:MAG: type II toxin-antitoxin system RelE/ParE family toxin [Candidatus Micrarchaeota archaeon]|nr:type II toxin-antitoxin system RelE/ParE family toxin [Candidatus Micrarchaeota archaeon]